MSHGSRIIVASIALVIAAAGTPAFAQIDLSGEWGGTYVDRVASFGTEWLTVYTIVDDPKHHSQQFITSTHFKREADGSKFMPVSCGE